MHKKNVLSITAALVLSSSSVALARYVPPVSQKPPSDYSRSTGVRSGCQNLVEGEMLVILAPQTYVGETTSVRPSFSWWTAIPTKVDFRLFEFSPDGSVKQVGKPLEINSSAGINQISLPPEKPPLQEGQKYLWQVALRCATGEYILERAELKVVPAPSELAQKESEALKQLERYAERGFWYDAFSETLQAASRENSARLCSSLLSSLAASEKLPEGVTVSDNAEVTLRDQRQTIENRRKILEEISRKWCS